MSLLSVFLAAGSLVSLVLSAPLHRPAPVHLTKRSSDTYTFYQGNGDTPPWPAQSSWVGTFEEMFSYNQGILQNSCTQFNVPNNSEQEIADISSGIQTVSSQTGVDPRFILAIMLQESNGCVRAPTTNGGVVNPGLFQDHDGSASCNNGGVVTNPCPADTITAMISQGVAGTSSGAGLVQCISQAASSGATQYYIAARIYNSGSVAAGGNLGEGVATHCYSSDVANRLTGWVSAPKTCTLDGAVAGGSSYTPVNEGGSGSSASSSSPAASSPAAQAPPANTPATTAQPPATTTTHAPKQTNKAPAQSGTSTPSTGSTQPASGNSNSSSGGSSTPGASLAPGVASPCGTYYTIQSGDTCDSVASKFSTTFATLQQLNTDLDSACSNLWLGYAYCVAA